MADLTTVVAVAFWQFVALIPIVVARVVVKHRALDERNPG